jgi:RNA polymerase sigma-70 factor (ECF subfamily)
MFPPSAVECGGEAAAGFPSTVNDDAELLQRIRAGAVDDFAEIVQRHQGRIFAILHRYERDAQRLEDLAQETFLKAWRALEQFDGRAPFEHWISRIAVRTALDHLRREKRRQNDIALPDLGDDALDWLRNPDEKDQPGSREAAEVLYRALNRLAPAERAILTMQELEGFSVKEIAATLGISGIAVRVRAVRARAKLKKTLQQLAEHE